MDVKSQTLGAIWRFRKAAGLMKDGWGTKGQHNKGLGASGLRALNPYTNQSIYRFGITDNPTCPCEEAEDQTTDHLIF
jgi:hypothetical protein